MKIYIVWLGQGIFDCCWSYVMCKVSQCDIFVGINYLEY